MDDKCGYGKKVQQHMKDVHELYQPEPGLSEGYLPFVEHQLLG